MTGGSEVGKAQAQFGVRQMHHCWCTTHTHCAARMHVVDAPNQLFSPPPFPVCKPCAAGSEMRVDSGRRDIVEGGILLNCSL